MTICIVLLYGFSGLNYFQRLMGFVLATTCMTFNASLNSFDGIICKDYSF